LEATTKLAIAAGVGIIVGGLIFILVGDGIAYFGKLLNDQSGVDFGSSLATTGFVVIFIVIVVFVSVVGYLVYRSRSNSFGWSGV